MNTLRSDTRRGARARPRAFGAREHCERGLEVQPRAQLRQRARRGSGGGRGGGGARDVRPQRELGLDTCMA